MIAPPPLLYGAFLGAGLALDYFGLGRATGVPASLRYGLAGVLAIAALAVALGALLRFRRAGTHAEPWRPATAIVTDGVYAFTRNPMYVGMTLLYLAVACAADSVATVVLAVPLLAVIRYGVIAREERYLEAKFGDEYRRYRQAVRRWL